MQSSWGMIHLKEGCKVKHEEFPRELCSGQFKGNGRFVCLCCIPIQSISHHSRNSCVNPLCGCCTQTVLIACTCTQNLKTKVQRIACELLLALQNFKHSFALHPFMPYNETSFSFYGSLQSSMRSCGRTGNLQTA